MNQSDRIESLKSLLKERIMVLDGAMGTAIQAKNLGPEDFGGVRFREREIRGSSAARCFTFPPVSAVFKRDRVDFMVMPCMNFGSRREPAEMSWSRVLFLVGAFLSGMIGPSFMIS